MFSQKLKELRTRDDISQAKFAREVGFSQSAIASWENETREPGINALIKIAQYFNVSVDYLIEAPTIAKQQPREKPAENTFDGLSAREQKLIEQFRFLKEGYKVLAEKQLKMIVDYQKEEPVASSSNAFTTVKNIKK